MKIEIYHEDDKEKVLDLFHKVWGRRMTAEFWDWRFVKSHQDTIRCLMWEDDQLIGNYIVHSVPMKIGNHLEKVLFSMDTLTHPDYRNKGVFTKLANFTYDIALKANYSLIFGFPNRNSYNTFFTKLGWIDLGNTIEYEKNITKSEPEFNNDSNYKITQISRFDDNVDNLWNNYEKEYNFLIPRTTDYLNWRFFEHPEKKFVDHPKTKYFAFLIERNGLKAYFVLKKFGSEKGHLVDYFGLLNDEIMEIIIRYAISFCLKNKLSILSFLSNYITAGKSVLEMHEKLGFIPMQKDTHFGIRLLQMNDEESITDKNRWFVNMCDSDVY